jgi:hypothetical protein
MVCGVGVNSFIPKAAELKSEQKRVHSKAHHSEVASGKAAERPADEIKAIRVSNADLQRATERQRETQRERHTERERQRERQREIS